MYRDYYLILIINADFQKEALERKLQELCKKNVAESTRLPCNDKYTVKPNKQKNNYAGKYQD